MWLENDRTLQFDVHKDDCAYYVTVGEQRSQEDIGDRLVVAITRTPRNVVTDFEVQVSIKMGAHLYSLDHVRNLIDIAYDLLTRENSPWASHTVEIDGFSYHASPRSHFHPSGRGSRNWWKLSCTSLETRRQEASLETLVANSTLGMAPLQWCVLTLGEFFDELAHRSPKERPIQPFVWIPRDPTDAVDTGADRPWWRRSLWRRSSGN